MLVRGQARSRWASSASSGGPSSSSRGSTVRPSSANSMSRDSRKPFTTSPRASSVQSRRLRGRCEPRPPMSTHGGGFVGTGPSALAPGRIFWSDHCWSRHGARPRTTRTGNGARHGRRACQRRALCGRWTLCAPSGSCWAGRSLRRFRRGKHRSSRPCRPLRARGDGGGARCGRKPEHRPPPAECSTPMEARAVVAHMGQIINLCAGGDHGRASVVDRVDDLGGVNPVEVKPRSRRG